MSKVIENKNHARAVTNNCDCILGKFDYIHVFVTDLVEDVLKFFMLLLNTFERIKIFFVVVFFNYLFYFLKCFF